MVISIVHLTLKGFASVFTFIYGNISLFHWVYFASFFDHYIEQNSCEVAGYRSATLLKLTFFTGIFERF